MRYEKDFETYGRSVCRNNVYGAATTSPWMTSMLSKFHDRKSVSVVWNRLFE